MPSTTGVFIHYNWALNAYFTIIINNVFIDQNNSKQNRYASCMSINCLEIRYENLVSIQNRPKCCYPKQTTVLSYQGSCQYHFIQFIIYIEN